MEINLNKSEYVKEQYVNNEKLSVRYRLHDIYSTNKQGFLPWLFEQMAFTENCSILELGCGDARIWENNIERLPRGCRLVLSDFSQGMADAARDKFKAENMDFRVIDICSIPYEDDTFDIILANHMLYHVPDLDRAITEVKRVLKPDGRFYAGTGGDNGMPKFLSGVVRTVSPGFDPDYTIFPGFTAFSLQSGGALLGKYFDDVKRVDYVDSLEVTVTKDLMDWLGTVFDFGKHSVDYDLLYDHFEKIRLRDGFIKVPKEVGVFVCG